MTVRSASRSAMVAYSSAKLPCCLPAMGWMIHGFARPDKPARRRLSGGTVAKSGAPGSARGRSLLGAFDALAKCHAHEAGDLDRRADLFCRLRDHVLDLALVVDDVGLFQQRHVLEELAQAAFDHLADHRLRPAGGLGLVGQYGPLALDNR